MSITKTVTLFVFLSAFSGMSAAESDQKDQPNKTQKKESEDPISSLMEGLNDEEKLDVIAEVGKPLVLDNYTSGEKDTIKHPHRLTAEQAVNYVPPFEELRVAYFEMVDKGAHPFAAALEANMLAMEILTESSEN